MAETKVGFDQVDVPAPLWYRKLTNVIIICVLPVYVGFINILKMSDYHRSIMAQIGMAAPFILKAIAMVIGNGQVYVPSNKVIENTKVWILIILLAALAGSSCSPGKKAHAYFNSHQAEFAEGCADAYPVRETTDSSAYKEGLRRIDSLNMARVIDSLAEAAKQAGLAAEIARLKVTAPAECDSLAEAIYAYAASESKRADAAERKLNQVTEAAKHIPPVIKEVENTARITAQAQTITAMAGAIASLGENLSKVTTERDALKARLKGKALIPWWIIIAALAIVGVGAAFKFKLFKFL